MLGQMYDTEIYNMFIAYSDNFNNYINNTLRNKPHPEHGVSLQIESTKLITWLTSDIHCTWDMYV